MDVYAAIAEPNRRRMLSMLAARELPVGALAAEFDITFQAVSQHLGVLYEAGLVTRRRQGRERLYTANPEPLREVHEWTGQYQRFWNDRIDRLNAMLIKRRRKKTRAS
ncbi:MAG TPA: metalloregulator ArsR/SmtB family transcription factor [Gemmatimonadaceae bacterium]|nr:metalloregulator ArsR/SmtB family transcription factor [Gemmatimonadaceae bacterium]